VLARCCGTLSASSLPHFEGKVCHGCNRATAPDATPLNYGHRLLAGAVIMHPYACHWCDPSSARLSIAIACQLSPLMQSFIVDSVVVVVVGPMTVRRLTRHRSGETEETPVPYHQWIGYEEVWPVIDSAPLGSSPETDELSPLHNSECFGRHS